MTLRPEMASSFARLTLGHVGRRYPFKLDQVLTGPEDLVEPHLIHPIFHGSFDWHSCVHGWWQLLTIARLQPHLAETAEIRARADEMLVAEKVAGELAVLARPYAAGFERPYGWAWALALHGEATKHNAGWGTALEPLARAFAERFKAHLPKLTYPIRVGTHYNTAFALVLARDWAVTHDRQLVKLIDARAREWFGEDRGCQAWEPGGDEFLSAALCEALLMSRVRGPQFAAWFEAFLPDAVGASPSTLFTPAVVSDRSDGKIAHLDGLNLSRAWCWRSIAAALPMHHIAPVARTAAADHLTASISHLDDDYMGTHWLATFALLALTT